LTPSYSTARCRRLVRARGADKAAAHGRVLPRFRFDICPAAHNALHSGAGFRVSAHGAGCVMRTRARPVAAGGPQGVCLTLPACLPICFPVGQYLVACVSCSPVHSIILAPGHLISACLIGCLKHRVVSPRCDRSPCATPPPDSSVYPCIEARSPLGALPAGSGRPGIWCVASGVQCLFACRGHVISPMRLTPSHPAVWSALPSRQMEPLSIEPIFLRPALG
jgi:hypothetical protein